MKVPSATDCYLSGNNQTNFWPQFKQVISSTELVAGWVTVQCATLLVISWSY